MNFAGIEERLGYSFADKSFLERALTLSSADNDNNNETLEFFGDAILEFLVSEIIYDEKKSEGQLTDRRKALVCDSALRGVAVKLGLDEFLVKSKGDNNNKKAVPSAYEAVIAAIYLDGGMDAARNFVKTTLDFTVTGEVNYKGELQELIHREKKQCPKYEVEEVGTPQRPRFRAKLEAGGRFFCGESDNKQRAEQKAAERALSFLKKRRGYLTSLS